MCNSLPLAFASTEDRPQPVCPVYTQQRNTEQFFWIVNPSVFLFDSSFTSGHNVNRLSDGRMDTKNKCMTIQIFRVRFNGVCLHWNMLAAQIPGRSQCTEIDWEWMGRRASERWVCECVTLLFVLRMIDGNLNWTRIHWIFFVTINRHCFLLQCFQTVLSPTNGKPRMAHLETLEAKVSSIQLEKSEIPSFSIYRGQLNARPAIKVINWARTMPSDLQVYILRYLVLLWAYLSAPSIDVLASLPKRRPFTRVSIEQMSKKAVLRGAVPHTIPTEF